MGETLPRSFFTRTNLPVQSGPLSPIVIQWTHGAPINGRKSMGFTGVNFHPLQIQIPNAKWSIRKFHMSYEKNLGWLFDIGDYTTHLYGDFYMPL